MYLKTKIQDFSLVTPNTNSIVTLAEIKDFLKETTNDYDTYIQNVINAVIRFVENQYLNFNILNTTYKVTLDNFSNYTLESGYYAPNPSKIYITKGKVHTVNHVKYKDKDNMLQTLDPAKYKLIQDFPFNFITSIPIQEEFPETYEEYNAVEIEFICGFGNDATSVPADLIDALKRHIAGLVENRILICDINNKQTPVYCENIYNIYCARQFFSVI